MTTARTPRRCRNIYQAYNKALTVNGQAVTVSYLLAFAGTFRQDGRTTEMDYLLTLNGTAIPVVRRLTTGRTGRNTQSFPFDGRALGSEKQLAEAILTARPWLLARTAETLEPTSEAVAQILARHQ